MAQASSEQPSGWETAGLHPCFVRHGKRWHEPYLFRASHKPTLAFLTEALLLLHTMHWSADPNHFTISPINSSPRLTHERLSIKLREPLVLREIFHSARLHGQPLHCFVLQEVLNQAAAVRLDGRPRRLCLWLFVSLGPTWWSHLMSCGLMSHQDTSGQIRIYQRLGKSSSATSTRMCMQKHLLTCKIYKHETCTNTRRSAPTSIIYLAS